MHYARIVADTKYMTNLRTVNLKIKVLVHIFRIPSPPIQQKKTFIWGEENLFYKTENVFFFNFFSKTKRLRYVVFCTSKN